ncbi:MAG: B12-binding domain-containing radical SAM protein [Longimicrobiales bacterium]
MTESRRRTRLLLAHSFYLRHDEKQLRKMKPYSPLATLIAAAVLRERGFEVHLFDAMLADGMDEYVRTLDQTEPDVVAVVEDNFNYVTKMCTARMREDALTMVRAARERGCRVAVNGSDASDHPARYLAAGADAVILGEVEPTLRELAAAWSTDRTAPLAEIAGLALAGGPLNIGEGARLHVHRTAARAFLTELDTLPLPAWDLVQVDRYVSAWTQAHGRLSWNMVTSRGCPYGCNWCAKPLWGRRYAQRSPHVAAEELAQLRARVNPGHVWFADDIFGLTPAWIEAFADHVAARDARIPFMMQSRVNLMKPRTVAALAASGAEEVWMGVESGAQAVLDAMDKGTTLEQVRSATRTLKEHGIRCGWFVMLGYPGEDWTDILRTRDLIRAEAPYDIGVSVAYPLPGTIFHERVRAQLGAQRNWRETDDLAMLFQGTYHSGFYRRVRDLLHAEVPADADERRVKLDAEWHELERREPGARTQRVAAASTGD